MTLERTDDQKLAMAPLKVRFGAKEYEIKLRRIGAAQRWREQFIKQMSEIVGQLKVEAGTAEAFMGGLGFVFLRFPEKMAELVFSYAPDLPREIIEGDSEDAGSEEQLACAFRQIIQVAFPFVQELGLVMQTLRLAASFPASARSTK